MKKIVVSILMVIGPCLFAQNLLINKEADAIYIASYNVYKLGDVAKKYKDIDAGLALGIPDRIKNSAKVLAGGDFDIITLQEVKDGPAGEAAVKDLVQALKDDHGQTFEWFVSEKIGKGLFDESIAFLYRANKVSHLHVNGRNSELIESVNPKNRKFAKTKWKAGDFDFTLISCHFSFIGNDPTRRQADFLKLKDILNNPLSYSDDPDVIVVGDFNRFGTATGGDFGVTKLDYDPTVWRAPNVTLFDPDFNKIREVAKADISALNIKDDNPQFLSTTCGKNSKVYDIFFFSKDVFEEFPTAAGAEVFGVDFGIFHFDEKDGIGHISGVETKSNGWVKNNYSDHRPIWMRFKINSGKSDY